MAAPSHKPAANDFSFPRAMRLAHNLEYQAVYNAKVRKSRGPLTVWALPTGRPHPRLGLSIGRKVGNAVVRNRLKRRIREAFRLIQHQLPNLDFVVSSSAHDEGTLEDYQRALLDVSLLLTKEWQRRTPPPPHVL